MTAQTFPERALEGRSDGHDRCRIAAMRHEDVSSRGQVLVVAGAAPYTGPPGHERATRDKLAEHLAELKGFHFAGDFDNAGASGSPRYLLPKDTLTLPDARDVYGIASEDDLFGGVVPHAFVATKTITHPLPAAHSVAPEGWCTAFPKRVESVVLPGWSAFSRDDARLGAMRLLADGPARIKLSTGIGGSGQFVVRDEAELEERLQSLDDSAFSNGLVVELNLKEVSTLSVGWARVGEMTVSYHGTQCEVRNNHGHMVYGGSSLVIVRGGWDALMALDMEAGVKQGCEQALAYDQAVQECFEGAFMSRRNYDVAQGVDDKGRHWSGVLEQSWRAGGASGAEIAAMMRFKADPSASIVRASTVELYGEGVQVPEGAEVYFQGIDRHVGALTKYVEVR